MDIHAISTALSSIKAATDIAKLIKDSNTSLEKAEIKLQIAELISSLADAQIEVAEVQNILLSKDKEINELRVKLEIKSKIVWEKPYYFLICDDEKDGPYCQHCYDTNSQLVRLQGGGKNEWFCHSCKGRFRDKNYVSPNSRTTRGHW
ncbi:hypothetical protein KUL42_43620 [Alteromonas sp. KUL42]|uniref:hypothetical protein n=1 Tax=Alteromonas sp. KUL42 TaxID=2480797 RepID=UPI001035EC99|nr:hypothetical protein [Alteromonas sp. KUL42]TAP30038.1 hypothetical protein EYR97_21645 [Alteromonas sp. KUL42]GEA09601.1 hypothetical protein KUL42_43620 [Alteromonas sp. KUL42]